MLIYLLKLFLETEHLSIILNPTFSIIVSIFSKVIITNLLVVILLAVFIIFICSSLVIGENNPYGMSKMQTSNVSFISCILKFLIISLLYPKNYILSLAFFAMGLLSSNPLMLNPKSSASITTVPTPQQGSTRLKLESFFIAILTRAREVFKLRAFE